MEKKIMANRGTKKNVPSKKVKAHNTIQEQPHVAVSSLKVNKVKENRNILFSHEVLKMNNVKEIKKICFVKELPKERKGLKAVKIRCFKSGTDMILSSSKKSYHPMQDDVVQKCTQEILCVPENKILHQSAEPSTSCGIKVQDLFLTRSWLEGDKKVMELSAVESSHYVQPVPPPNPEKMTFCAVESKNSFIQPEPPSPNPEKMLLSAVESSHYVQPVPPPNPEKMTFCAVESKNSFIQPEPPSPNPEKMLLSAVESSHYVQPVPPPNPEKMTFCAVESKNSFIQPEPPSPNPEKMLLSAVESSHYVQPVPPPNPEKMTKSPDEVLNFNKWTDLPENIFDSSENETSDQGYLRIRDLYPCYSSLTSKQREKEDHLTEVYIGQREMDHDNLEFCGKGSSDFEFLQSSLSTYNSVSNTVLDIPLNSLDEWANNTGILNPEIITLD